MPAHEHLANQFGRYLLTTEMHLHSRYRTPLYADYSLWHEDLPERGGEMGKQVGTMRLDVGAAMVDSMYLAKPHRAIAGVMLGVAHNLTREHSDRPLTPGDSLSVHSDRLAQHAIDRGLLRHDFVPHNYNPSTWTAHDETYEYRGNLEEDVQRHEIEAGRHVMRQMLRRARHIG